LKRVKIKKKLDNQEKIKRKIKMDKSKINDIIENHLNK